MLEVPSLGSNVEKSEAWRFAAPISRRLGRDTCRQNPLSWFAKSELRRSAKIEVVFCPCPKSNWGRRPDTCSKWPGLPVFLLHRHRLTQTQEAAASSV